MFSIFCFYHLDRYFVKYVLNLFKRVVIFTLYNIEEKEKLIMIVECKSMCLDSWSSKKQETKLQKGCYEENWQKIIQTNL